MRKRIIFTVVLLMLAGCTPFRAKPTIAPTVIALAPSETPQPTATPAPSPTTQPNTTPTTTQPSATLAVTATPSELLTSEQRDELFNDVWQTVNDTYLYPDFNGVDWEQVRRDFAPQVQAAVSDDDVYTHCS